VGGGDQLGKAKQAGRERRYGAIFCACVCVVVVVVASCRLPLDDNDDEDNASDV
jgi:hypothetical protein